MESRSSNGIVCLEKERRVAARRCDCMDASSMSCTGRDMVKKKLMVIAQWQLHSGDDRD